MNIAITIRTSNAAFEHASGAEAARILRKLAMRLQGQYELRPSGESLDLRDINGNTVGEYEATP